MDKAVVGVLGATSLVGKWLLPMLSDHGAVVFAFSRKIAPRETEPAWNRSVRWYQLPLSSCAKPAADIPAIENWICLAPLWVLSEYFSLLSGFGLQRLVALSSTSLFSKQDSSNQKERRLALDLKRAEEAAARWAEQNAIQLTILRPTLIYGSSDDGNISRIMRFILYFGFFPLFQLAQGLRQPVHGEDVAKACLSALDTSRPGVRCLNISGGDVLSYREMIERVFRALGKTPRFVHVPISVFRAVVALLSFYPRLRDLSASMAERMNKDLDFDHSEAKKELGFAPRNFEPENMLKK